MHPLMPTCWAAAALQQAGIGRSVWGCVLGQGREGGGSGVQPTGMAWRFKTGTRRSDHPQHSRRWLFDYTRACLAHTQQSRGARYSAPGKGDLHPQAMPRVTAQQDFNNSCNPLHTPMLLHALTGVARNATQFG